MTMSDAVRRRIENLRDLLAEVGGGGEHDHDAEYAPLSHVGEGGSAHAGATTSVDGFMSAADKTRFDTLPWGKIAAAKVTSSQGSLGAGPTDLTGLTSGSFTAVAGRILRVTLTVSQWRRSGTMAAADAVWLGIRNGSNTKLYQKLAAVWDAATPNYAAGLSLVTYLTPSAGSLTIKGYYERAAGAFTGEMVASAVQHASLLVEDVGPA